MVRLKDKASHAFRLSKSDIAHKTLLILICVSAGFLGGRLGNSGASLSSTTIEAKQQIVSSESQLISGIAKSVGASVVSVNATGETGANVFGFRSSQVASAGTGFIISDQGVILTNRHVVPAGSSSVSVTLSDGTKFDNVEVIGRTGESDSLDIAFLKIRDTKGKKLTVAKIGDSSKVQVGDKVIAIGNALGQFQNTVTSGIISGYGRSVQAGDGSGSSSETLQNLFQTDTSINRGNSGGPLVNLSGEVIGINTAVAGNAENIGFSIPVNDVQGLIKGVLEKGKLLRPYLGVRYVSLTDDYAYQYNIGVKRGAYIAPSTSGASSIADGSPAAKAGLQEKDVIIKIDNTNIDENNSLTSVLGRKTVGDKVAITVVRGGKEKTLTVVLEAAPEQ